MSIRRKALKKGYVWFHQGHHPRKISRDLKNSYGITIPSTCMTSLYGPRHRSKDFTEREHSLIRYLYENCRDTDKIVSYLNNRLSRPITKPNLITLAHRNGYSKRNRQRSSNFFLSIEQEKEIVHRFLEGDSCNKLKDKYGFKTAKSVSDILKKNGIDAWGHYLESCEISKRYKDFSLATVDSPLKAYFLGLMATDGWVNENRRSVSLSLIDEDCIRFLSESIGCSYASFKKKDVNSQPFHKFEMKGKIYDELTALGITPRKTKNLSLNFDLIDKDLFPYLFRGIVDGDGWVRKDGKEFFVCSASKPFLDSLIPYLYDFGMHGLQVKEKEEGFYLLRSAKKQNLHVLKSFYADPFGMERKRALLQNDVQRP